jgi:hypothetical protein
MSKRWLLALLVLAVMLDLALTFSQYYQMPLDGDLAAIVVPRADYAPVLHDPFGWAALTQNAIYSAPNRFFAHISMYWYFRHVPLWLQGWVSPISSAYAALALFNTLVQALLLYVLGWYATGVRRLDSLRLWVAMALMAPFFQSGGFGGQMALITPSISYSFAYSFPLLLLLVLLWPLYRAAWLGQALRIAWPKLVAMLLLTVVLAFNGPIIPATALVLGAGVGLHALVWLRDTAPKLLVNDRWRRLLWQPALVWGWLAVLCLYSLYIGRNNAENLAAVLPLWQRYQLVPLGVWEELTSKLGLPLLVLGCIANAQLIRRLLPPTSEAERIVRLLRWLGWFALVYVALLPLGGYRNYRPHILRHDSILPITLGLVSYYALSVTYLLAHLAGRSRRWYLVAVLGVAAIFINADRKLTPRDNNICERHALEVLAHAGPEPMVRLPDNCRVMSWNLITDPNESATPAELLEYWGVTKGRKRYYYATP